jgi:hypothetical protein
LNNLIYQHNLSMANLAGRYILDQTALGSIIVDPRLGISEHCQDYLIDRI